MIKIARNCKCNMNFIDLFAGAGGLSEGFIRAGFQSIAHVKMNKDACDSI
jgi:DNA (cytosine-5)-methyltransferase 1